MYVPNQCMQAIKRNAPAYCLTQGCWPNVQCLMVAATSECTVFISWVQSTADSGLAPHSLLVTINVLFLTFPVFIKALCVWTPPVPVLGNHHKSDCSSPSGREPHHSPSSVICALQFLIPLSSVTAQAVLGLSILTIIIKYTGAGLGDGYCLSV